MGIKKTGRGGQPTCARVYRTSIQTLTSDTWTGVGFEVEDFDVGAMVDLGAQASRITIPTGEAGKYLVTGLVQFAADGTQTGLRVIAIHKNGTSIQEGIRANGLGTDNSNIPVTAILDLAAGDYLELFVLQNSGGNLNINGDANGVFINFAAHRLS